MISVGTKTGPGYRADLGEFRDRRRERETVEVARPLLAVLVKIADEADFDCEDCPVRRECERLAHLGHACNLAMMAAREAIAADDDVVEIERGYLRTIASIAGAVTLSCGDDCALAEACMDWNWSNTGHVCDVAKAAAWEAVG